ncbi:hypothetical protein WN51_04179 [Melipona quadrifasciata]|uniref:Uncharacterized protein n=1 Tax=Melipona quadrifasciata TaxID=166423 RepID=A0A0M8ZVZ7_9HYME|nr:hypothetical protein WN51_04179 [Melipona quadrifasciata]
MKSMAAIDSLACHLRAMSATIRWHVHFDELKRFTSSSPDDSAPSIRRHTNTTREIRIAIALTFHRRRRVRSTNS